MKRLILFSILPLLMSSSVYSQSATASPYAYPKGYIPDSKALHDQIVRMDSLFFAAYNNCAADLAKYSSFYADSIEFYHDKGGFTSSLQEVIDGTKKNVCGKVTRILIPGTIEVYPIKGYGAIEMGMHRFHNNTEKEDTPSRAGKFIIIWRYTDQTWKISRVVSLH
ncbi:MAG: hypothetical protein JWP88_1269 [Flaviaesturariibacter sp.]|nr:hypothetical protein [Flaviaesturariibacter sp.]